MANADGQRSLSNKRVLITGGASGIGEACCRMFADAGAYVVVADRNASAGEDLQDSIRASGIDKVRAYEQCPPVTTFTFADSRKNKVHFVQVDVTSWDSQLRLFDQALDFFPGRELDILVTSAGIKGSPDWQTQPTDPDALKDATARAPPATQCLDVGLTGTMYSAHIATTYAMGLHTTRTGAQQNHSKSVILIGSSAGYRHLPGRPDYTVLKWGIRGLFRSLRHELFSAGVRVNLLAPTFVPTRMIADRIPALQEQGFRLAAMGDVLQAVRRMATDHTIVGRSLCVAGDGVHDLGDDSAGLDGGQMHKQLIDAGVLPPAPVLPRPEV